MEVRGEPKFPYPEFRPGQREVASYVEKAVREGYVLALQAPTGFGKTAAVIYGLVKAKPDKVIYVVRTRNEIQPVVRELSRFRVSYTFLYSARRMCPLFRRHPGNGDEEEDYTTVEDFWEACKLARLKGICHYYTNLQGADANTVEKVVEEAGEDPYLAVALLSSYKLCPFFALKILIEKATFVVATYPYLFNPDIFTATFEPKSYSDFVVVVDEAHSLIEAHTMMERRLSLNDIDRAVGELKSIGEEELLKKLKSLRSLITGRAARGAVRLDPNRLLKQLGDPEDWEPVVHEVRLRKISEALTGNEQAVKTYVSRILAVLDALARGARVYLITENGRTYLKALPVDPCTVTETPLNEARAVILMSGTMPPTSMLRDLLCISKKIVNIDVELFYPQVAAMYSNYRRTIVAAELTSKFSERTSKMFRLYADYIKATVSFIRHGIVLAVFPSYEFMNNVIRELKNNELDELGEVVVEGRLTTISEVHERLRELEGRMVVMAVAGGKLVEGVEYVDEHGRTLIRVVFVAGVPYPQPDPIFEDYLNAVSKKLGETKARDYVFNVTATIRVKQAIGRAQRSPGDRVLIVLGDRRFLYRRVKELLKLRYDAISYNLDSFTKKVQRLVKELELNA